MRYHQRLIARNSFLFLIFTFVISVFCHEGNAGEYASTIVIQKEERWWAGVISESHGCRCIMQTIRLIPTLIRPGTRSSLYCFPIRGVIFGRRIPFDLNLKTEVFIFPPVSTPFKPALMDHRLKMCINMQAKHSSPPPVKFPIHFYLRNRSSIRGLSSHTTRTKKTFSITRIKSLKTASRLVC